MSPFRYVFTGWLSNICWKVDFEVAWHIPTFHDIRLFMQSYFLKSSTFIRLKYVSYHFSKLLVFLLSLNICSSLVIYILNLYVNILEINIAVNGLSKLNTCDCFAFKQFWVDCIIHKFNILQSSITLNSITLNPLNIIKISPANPQYRLIPPIHEGRI